MLLILPLLLSAPALIDDPPLPALDQVLLVGKDKPLEVRIVFADAERLVYRKKSKVEELARSEVQSYTWVDEAQAAVLPRLAEASKGALDKENLFALADQCAETNLPGEAILVRWMGISQRKGSAAMHAALLHREEGEHWRVRLGTRWIRDDKLDEHCADWGNAWEFSTAHFDVRSNLPLSQVITVAMDAEQVYDAFFRLLGPELGLYRPTARLSLHVHAAQESYPHGDEHVSMYDPVELRTEINAAAGYRADILARRLTRHLLDASSRELGDKASLPAWVWEGLAGWLEAVLGLTDIRAREIQFDAARRHELKSAMHRTAEETDDLERVLRFSFGDFLGDAAPVREAQSYTLIEFLLFGDEGAHRVGFQNFVKGAMQGKGSPTDFKKTLPIEIEELERRWLAHVGRK